MKKSKFQEKKVWNNDLYHAIDQERKKNKYLYLSQAVSPGDIIKAKNSQIQGSQTEAFNGKEEKCKSFFLVDLQTRVGS